MIDELTIATSVLAAFTGVLAIVTGFYAYYTRQLVLQTKQQVQLMKIGHELTKKDIAVKALAAMASISPVLISKEKLDEKLKELGFDET